MFIHSTGAGTSMLHSSLAEARRANECGILWLGSLGYLIVAELVGATVAKARTSFSDRSNPTRRFNAGILEFAPHPVSDANAKALWALRCSIGHIFGLSKEHPHGGPHFRFILDESGVFIRPALQAWDGSTLPIPYDDMKARRREATIVNVLRLHDYVERLVTNIERHHARHNVRLRPGLTSDQALAFRQMFVGDL